MKKHSIVTGLGPVAGGYRSVAVAVESHPATAKQDAVAMSYTEARVGDDSVAITSLLGRAQAGVRGVACSLGLHYAKVKAGNLGAALGGPDGRAQAGDEGLAHTRDKGLSIAGIAGVAIAGERGLAIAGAHGVAVSGLGGAAAAGIRGRLIISHRGPDGHHLHTAEVDGKTIHPDIIYCLDHSGRFVEAAELNPDGRGPKWAPKSPESQAIGAWDYRV